VHETSFYDAVRCREGIDNRVRLGSFSRLARVSHESADKRRACDLEASTAVAGGDSVTQEVTSAWNKRSYSTLRARGMRLRGSEQDRGRGSERARGTRYTPGEPGTKKKNLLQIATQNRDSCTYLRLIVLCTINNEIKTRSVRRSVHRLEADERAEKGTLRAAITTGSDYCTSLGTRDFPLLIFPLSQPEGTRARETDERASVDVNAKLKRRLFYSSVTLAVTMPHIPRRPLPHND